MIAVGWCRGRGGGLKGWDVVVSSSDRVLHDSIGYSGRVKVLFQVSLE